MTLPTYRPTPEQEDWLRVEVAKHMGPGPHPSGSPQDVHAGGRQTRSVGGIKAGDRVWRGRR